MLSLLILLISGAAEADIFTLGYLTGSERRPGDIQYHRPGLTISGAISLAVDEINTSGYLRGGHRLAFKVAETYGEETESILKTAQLWTQNISVYIGPQETCLHEGRMAAAFNLPMISYFCTLNETSDKRKFPTFARTRPSDTQISKSVASVLLNFNWRQVTFFYLNSADSEFGKVAATILATMEEAGINVRTKRTWDKPFVYGYMPHVPNPFYELVKDTYQDSRIYVILGHHDEYLGLMVVMKELGLLAKGEYFIVGVDIEQYDSDNPGKYLKGLLVDDSDPVLQKAFQNFIGIVGTPPVTGYENFTVLVNEYMKKGPFYYPNPLDAIGGVKKIRAEAAYLYDAVYLYADALNDILDHGEDPRNGTTVINYIKGRSYQSIMGYIVKMDENADAEGNYTLVTWKPHHTSPGEYGLYPVGVFHLNENNSRIPDLHLTDSINWVNGKPPIAEPRCGFRGEKCISYTGEIAAGVAGGVVLVLAVISLVIYRNWRYEQELDSLLWKVDYKDIQMNEDTSSTLETKITRAIHPLIRTSQVSLSSNPDADFRYSTIYTQIGIYRGRVFAIKKVKKKSVDITRKMKKELKMMRDLRHDNLNAFIGACTDPPNICIVTEYCTRGSLKDILENEDVKLDNMFIASLVGDIVRGMIYLHDSPVRSHGNLKSSNCLVDSRWVLKISDFGLHEFKKDAEASPGDIVDPQRKCEDLLYTAPELLRDPNAPPCGTQRGDTYSFAIILYEIHSRHGPFGEIGMTPAEILRRVINRDPVSPPFRPHLELLENSFDFVRDCLKESWTENPEERPDFKTVRTKLRPMRKGMKPNIFDNMIAMMEKYANNLEALVDERTDQLIEEKKKTEALLYEMLPRYVAEQLKRGNKVEAESFDCVTIYFSDIVGFTSMSAESTPLQVVDFLNDLYTCFDSTIENYDVYKVETIGDAYMVVSGLPIRNGDQHAGEIASMSLQLLESVKRFQIRHRPGDNLMLRIGIHSGPVCAGVVGLKMPRYCLFGDTVNTASRMESTGMPLKIHCSDECKILLDKLEGYFIEERGLIKMKGKGEKLTYWLVGEDPEKRAIRTEARLRRLSTNKSSRKSQKNGINGFPGAGVPRSSLKKSKNPVTRTASLESPKRLRFASGPLELHEPSSPGDGATSGSSSRKASSESSNREKRNSCPCMKNLEVPHENIRVPKVNCSSVPAIYHLLEEDGSDFGRAARYFRSNTVCSAGSEDDTQRGYVALSLHNVCSQEANDPPDCSPLLPTSEKNHSCSEIDFMDRETPV